MRLALVGGCAAFFGALPLVPWAAEPMAGQASQVGQVGQVVQQTLEPVVVTATRVPTPLSAVLADVTVITGEQVERAGGSVLEALRRHAGVQITRTGGPGNNTEVFLRGAYTRHLAVLIDGVRVDSQSGSGGADWAVLQASQIDRIEVLRGPASAVYGSDASAGVVQIITRRGGPRTQASLGVAAGTRDRVRTEAALSGALGSFDYALGAGRDRSGGFSARTGTAKGSANADRDGYTTHTLHARLGWQLNDDHRLELAGDRADTDAGYDPTTPSKVGEDRAVRTQETARAQWSARWSAAWSSELVVAQSSHHYRTPPLAYRSATRVDTVTWLNQWKEGPHTATAALEHRQDHLRNTDLDTAPSRGSASRHDEGLALGYGWRQAGTSAQISARADDDSEFGRHETGSLALGQDIGQAWHVHGSYGSAFRAPTLYQRFSRFGNPLLKPETSRTLELGLRYRQAGASASLTVFDTRVSDLIVTQKGTTACEVPIAGNSCYRSVGRARLKGASLSGEIDVGDVRLSAQLNVESPKNALTDKVIARRARRHGSVRADWDAQGTWTFGAEVLAYGRRFDDDANLKELGGYSLVNLDARYRFSPEWALSVNLDNAAGHRYETALGYGVPPRTVLVALTWTPRR